MTKALYIIDNLFDYIGATHICGKKIADGLSARGFEPYFFCMRIGNARIEIGKYPNLCESHSIHYDGKFAMNEKMQGLKGRIEKACRWMVKCIDWAIGKATGFTINFSRAMHSRKNVRKALRFIQENGIDTIVSFSFPFASHVLAAKIKASLKGRIEWVACEFDPYTYNYTLPKLGIEFKKAREARTLASADLIVMSCGIQDENRRHSHLVELDDKTITLPPPGCDFDTLPSNGTNSPQKATPLKLVYTGMFYKDIRSPGPVLDYLNQSALDYELHIYGDQPGWLMAEWKARPSVFEKTHFHGACSKEECDEACGSANVLLNVDNDVPNMVPSKLFAYMSTGRPILDFCHRAYGVSRKYAKLYPSYYACEKKATYSKEEVDEIDSFCLNARTVLRPEELDPIRNAVSSESVYDRLAAAIRSAQAQKA